MLIMTGTALCALAAICVAMEALGPAALIGGIGYWLISHGG